MPYPTSTIFRLRFQYSSDEGQYGFDLWYAEATPTGISRANQILLANAAIALFGPLLQAVMPVDCAILSMSLTAISPTLHNEVFPSTGDFPLWGSVESDSLPQDSAVCIQRRSIYAGRSKHGRIFLPCVPEANTILSIIEPDAMAGYTAIGAAMLVSLNTGSTYLHPACIDWKNGLVLGLSSTKVNHVICSQMRRRHRQMTTHQAGSVVSPLD